MPLYKLELEQTQIIIEMMNNFILTGNKEAYKKYILETDEIEKALSEPLDLDIKEKRE